MFLFAEPLACWKYVLGKTHALQRGYDRCGLAIMARVERTDGH